MTIVLIDTSVLCEFIEIPGKCSNSERIKADLINLVRQNSTLLLPIATILETGRHISQVADGQVRRQKAIELVTIVQDALRNRAPWTITQPIWDSRDIDLYIDEFPEYAMRWISLGDLSIIKEFDRQCDLHTGHVIYIWSLDNHLSGYRRNPPQWMNGG
jgi:hypothetical protein